jgi:ATP/maltotriose-dependent transcriptional regulator MalT
MPRKARIDAPGALHHIIVRGIERRKIFYDNGYRDPFLERFSNREIDVLLLLAERLSNKEIAERFFVSPDTVKKHTINIYRKLGVNDRRQAVVTARTLGILPLK